MSTANELPYHVELVQEFYANLKVNPTTLLARSTVRKTNILLSPDILGQILRIPNAGLDFFKPNDWPLPTPREEVVKIYNPNPNPENFFEVRAGKLTPLQKVLFWIIHENVLPMDGGKGVISMEMLAYLYALDTHQPINLPLLMLKQMHLIETSSRNTHQGYGSYLTKVFKHFGVPLTCPTILEPDESTQFGEQRVKLFHVLVKENRLVSETEAATPVRAPTPRVPNPGAGDSSGPSASTGPSISAGLKEMLFVLEGNIFRRIDERLVTIHEDLIERQERLENRMSLSLQALRTDVMDRLRDITATGGGDEDGDED